MTKIEYMSELEGLLLDLPFDEREEAMQYYNDYFEDAGPDNADRVIEDLGPPERVARIIKSDLNHGDPFSNEDKIYTENGYKDMSVEDDRFEVAKDSDLSEEENQESTFEQKEDYSTDSVFQESDFRKESSNDKEMKRKEDWENYKDKRSRGHDVSKIILIIVLCVFAIPVGIPVLATVFSLIVSVAAVVFCLFLVAVILAVVFCITGVVLVGGGIYHMFLNPLNGILLCGVGLILFGLGLIFTVLVIAMCTKLIPVMVRGIINLCRLPFRKRGAGI